MLKLSASLLNQPVMSLRTGAEVARTDGFIINPHNLKIEGFYCTDRFSGEILVLLPQDIRDIIPQGIAVNDHEVLASPDDLIRLKETMDIDFQLPNKTVLTENKKRIGKVSDFAIDSDSLYILKIYVGQSVFKSLSGGQLSVDRNQIVETTPDYIIIKDPLQPTPASVPAAAA